MRWAESDRMWIAGVILGVVVAAVGVLTVTRRDSAKPTLRGMVSEGWLA